MEKMLRYGSMALKKLTSLELLGEIQRTAWKYHFPIVKSTWFADFLYAVKNSGSPSPLQNGWGIVKKEVQRRASRMHRGMEPSSWHREATQNNPSWVWKRETWQSRGRLLDCSALWDHEWHREWIRRKQKDVFQYFFLKRIKGWWTLRTYTNTRKFRLKGTSGCNLVQLPLKEGPKGALSCPVLNTSKNADPTASLGSLIQCYQTEDLKQLKKIFYFMTFKYD